jgi:hypothetical protein
MGFKPVEVKNFEKSVKSVNDWRVGESVTGYYLGLLAKRQTMLKGKPTISFIYGLEVDGKELTFWNCKSLDVQLANVDVGWLTRITYKGKKEFKGGLGHHFEVEVDKDRTKEDDIETAQLMKQLGVKPIEVGKMADESEEEFEINWDD